MRGLFVMAISINGFKEWAGWPQAGSKAVGLLVITRTDPSDQTLISIPKTTAFTTGGMTFNPVEDHELNQSQRMIEIVVQSSLEGSKGNVASGQDWGSALTGVTLGNPGAFSQGIDSVKITDVANSVLSQNINDRVVQSNLDSSVAIVKDMIGDSMSPLPDVARVDQAVFTLALFFLENVSFKQETKSLNIDPLNFQKTSHFLERLEPMVYKRVRNLIAPYRKIWAFVPPYKQPEAM